MLSPLFRYDFHKVELPFPPIQETGQTVIAQTRVHLCSSFCLSGCLFFLFFADLKFIFNLVKYTQSCKCDLKYPLVSNSDIRDADGLRSRSVFASFATNRKLLLNPWRVNVLALWHQWKLFRRVFSFLKNRFFLISFGRVKRTPPKLSTDIRPNCHHLRPKVLVKKSLLGFWFSI